MDDTIQTKPLSTPKAMNKLDMAVNVENISQSFVTHRKHNHSAIAYITNNNVSKKFHLGYDPL